MINEEVFNTEFKEVDHKLQELHDKRKTLINLHKIDIDAKLNEEFEKFVEVNKDRIVSEVLGEELTEIEEEIKVAKAVYDAYQKIVTVAEESTITTEEVNM